jgi:hypothetical protein
MPQPRFEHLTERLLQAGIAPRHVRRYTGELKDHFDDLAREEMARGATREIAEANALSRLGHDDDLANVMLARPELRSFTARFPWAVFGLGPVAMLIAGLAAAILLEIGLLNLVGAGINATGWKPGPADVRAFNFAAEIWNTLAVYGAPLGIAALLYLVGSRQRMPSLWIVLGVAIVCVLGGFQNLVWYDTGVKGGGVMSLGSGLLPPFPHFAQGLARAAANLALAGGVWWFATWRKASTGLALSHTAGT